VKREEQDTSSEMIIWGEKVEMKSLLRCFLMEFLKEHGYDFSCGSSGNDIIFWKKKK
jgi:hypothetical protein